MSKEVPADCNERRTMDSASLGNSKETGRERRVGPAGVDT